jgi:creatinine amidohydrolase/Fe(II)-dependent formamide hydrolase-like protein
MNMNASNSFVIFLLLLHPVAEASSESMSVTPPLRVDFEMMTWPEVKSALADGRDTALIYNGGTEERGPQDVNGGHTLMAHATVVAIAQRLRNAIAMPVLPFSVNDADPDMPGTIGLSETLFLNINEQVAEQAIKNGFKKIVLMGDHGGGQQQLMELAGRLDHKHGQSGIRVVYCGDVYKKANDDFNHWLLNHGYPQSLHGGISDTSEMLYLGANKEWVRVAQLPNSLGSLTPPTDKAPLNGIIGDGRRSTAALGKIAFDMKVNYAVIEITALLQ